MNCFIFDRDKLPQRLMKAALCSSGRAVDVKISDQKDVLLKSLEKRTELVFSVATEGFKLERKLIKLCSNYSPDSILVRVSRDEWRKPTTVEGVEVFTLATKDEDVLLVQLDFLLRYALLKKKFRLSKQLLSLSEIRYQQLVDSSNDPIAFIGHGMLLYANIEYLSLMGFKSVAEAASIPVRHLINQQERGVFSPLCQQIEQRVSGPGQLKLSLEPLGHAPIRADVSLQPASYRGKRCVQMRLRPHYEDLELPIRPSVMLNKANNPWDKTPKQLANRPLEKPTTQTKPSLQFSLNEALNLKQSTRPTLLLAENWLKQPNGTYQLYQTVKPKQQIRLDLWTIRKVVIRLLAEQEQAKDDQQAIVDLCHATLNDSQAQQQILTTLSNTQDINTQLWFAISFSDLRHLDKNTQQFVAQLYKLGVRFVIDEVVQESPTLFELARRINAVGLRLSVSVGESVQRLGHVSADLTRLINWSESKKLVVIMGGVKDIASMNRLSATHVSYLQGPVLHNFLPN